ncbi:MAG: hypothetical protein GF344_16345, partial [Chitinivibrionales bacterium]|nr:hypothetical protein [Chitinivibrionales bacterium]MBD3358268.1 hypothetical protein [Chitinivibrionales bacterium]
MRNSLVCGLILGSWMLGMAELPGESNDSTAIKATKCSVLSFTGSMLAFMDNTEYFNDFLDGYLHLGAWFTGRLVYRPVDQLSFAVGVHLRKAFGDERFLSEARPVFRASYRAGRFRFTIGEIESSNRHGLPDLFLNEQWTVRHGLEEGLQLLYKGEAVHQDCWAVYDSLNTPGYREHLMLGNATFIKRGPLTFMALAYVDHYGGQEFAPEGDPVRENVVGGLGVRFVHDREGIPHTLGAEEIGVLSLTSNDREKYDHQQGGGSYTRLWITAAGFQTSLMVFKGSQFIAWKGNPLYRARDIYYYIETRKRIDFSPAAWLEFGLRLDF